MRRILPVLAAAALLLPLAALSVLAGTVMLLVFRFTTDQKSLRVAKDRMQAQLLAVRVPGPAQNLDSS